MCSLGHTLHDEHHTASIVDSLCASVGQLGRAGILAPLLANLATRKDKLNKSVTQLMIRSPFLVQATVRTRVDH